MFHVDPYGLFYGFRTHMVLFLCLGGVHKLWMSIFKVHLKAVSSLASKPYLNVVLKGIPKKIARYARHQVAI